MSINYFINYVRKQWEMDNVGVQTKPSRNHYYKIVLAVQEINLMMMLITHESISQLCDATLTSYNS